MVEAPKDPFSDLINTTLHDINPQLFRETSYAPMTKEDIASEVREFDEMWRAGYEDVTPAQKEKVVRAIGFTTKIGSMHDDLQAMAQDEEGQVQQDALKGIEYFKAHVFTQAAEMIRSDLRSVATTHPEIVNDVLINFGPAE